MPLYEYQCPACGHRFEVLQHLGEGGDGLACPECGQPRPERKLSTFSAGGESSSASASAGACCRGPGFT
jgi:putative FmdB family regulatory protein